MKSKLKNLTAAILVTAGVTAGAQAQETPTYTLDGETIRFLLVGGPGGMSDVQTRLLLEYIGRHLPGDPDFVVQNIPGAGGLRMLEYLDDLDTSTDLVIFGSQSGMPFRARAGLLDADLYDPRTVNWIGSFRGSTLYCLVTTDTGVETLDDLREQEVLFGATAVTGNDYAIYALLNDQLGLKINPIVGYESGGEIALAIERGEVQGICNNYANFKQFLEPMAEDGRARILFVFGPDRRADIDAPYLFDLEMPEEARDFIFSAVSAISFGGPYAIPDDADPAFVEAVREAFEDVMNDPEFLAAAEAAGIDLAYTPHEAISAAIDDLYNASEQVIEQIGDLFFGE